MAKKKSPPIRKAVIAAAGYGTRFLPATKVQPKEMLPLIDKPIIQYLVEEAVNSGIRDIIIVTRAGQHILEDHFDSSFELEAQLKNNHKIGLLRKVKKIPQMANFIYLRQTKDYPYGNGSPLLVAKNLIGKNEPFVYMFGDDLVKSKVPCTKQLINFWKKHGDSGKVVIAAQEVSWKETSRYGVLRFRRGSNCIVEGIVEKPKAKKAPSNLVQFGRFILNSEVIKILEKKKLGKGGELWLADALCEHAGTGKVLATKIKGSWLTTGDPLRYMQTMVEFALDRKDIGPEFKKYLQQLNL
jgi:UTP--glucose-1-phosphate uridylyltransferase